MNVPERILSRLIRDVELLCLDAGNTVVFLDHARLAEVCRRLGFDAATPAFVAAEGAMKNALESGDVVDVAWPDRGAPGARSWGITLATILKAVGVPLPSVPDFLSPLWAEHVERNFWSKVPEGLEGSLGEARRTGVRVAIVSNSEGRLEALLDTLGLLASFDLVVDSGRLGIEKPDPRIFRAALSHFDVVPSHALHLGDTFATDVLGARAAGVRAALIDPHHHYDGRHTDVPRVAAVRDVALALAAARKA